MQVLSSFQEIVNRPLTLTKNLGCKKRKTLILCVTDFTGAGTHLCISPAKCLTCNQSVIVFILKVRLSHSKILKLQTIFM